MVRWQDGAVREQSYPRTWTWRRAATQDWCVLENTAFFCVFIKGPSLSVKTNVGVRWVRWTLLLLLLATTNTTCWSVCAVNVVNVARLWGFARREACIQWFWLALADEFCVKHDLLICSMFFLGWSQLFSGRDLPQFNQTETQLKLIHLPAQLGKLFFGKFWAFWGQLADTIAMFYGTKCPRIFTLILFHSHFNYSLREAWEKN